MSVVLDLHIQDFVRTYRIGNRSGQGWLPLVNRSARHTGSVVVAEYDSGNTPHLARIRNATLPDAEWLLIELWVPDVSDADHRFECLQMLSSQTHSEIRSSVGGDRQTLVQLRTRHPGLVNVCFIFHGNHECGANPWLVALGL